MVGAASRDLVADDPRGWRLGGAAAYASLALAKLGVQVRALIGADALAAEASELDLIREAGAEVRLVPLEHGPVFENVEAAGGRIQRCHSASDPVPVVALPHGWGRELVVLLLSVAGELDDAWAAVPRPDALVAVGWQGMLRTLLAGAVVRRRAPGRRAALDRADLVGVSEDDVDPGTTPGLPALVGAATTLIVTRGAAGGWISRPATAAETPSRSRRARRRYRAISSDRVVDPTGAGDVFLAAMVAARIEASRIRGSGGRASEARFAAAAASLAIEAPGLLGVPDLASVLRRMRRRSSARADS